VKPDHEIQFAVRFRLPHEAIHRVFLRFDARD
jgi:hypothetical protein